MLKKNELKSSCRLTWIPIVNVDSDDCNAGGWCWKNVNGAKKSKEWTGMDRDLKIGAFFDEILSENLGCTRTHNILYHPFPSSSPKWLSYNFDEWKRKDLVSIQSFDKRFGHGDRSRSLPLGLLESKEVCRERRKIIRTCVSIALTSWTIEFQYDDRAWPVPSGCAGGDTIYGTINRLSSLQRKRAVENVEREPQRLAVEPLSQNQRRWLRLLEETVDEGCRTWTRIRSAGELTVYINNLRPFYSSKNY